MSRTLSQKSGLYRRRTAMSGLMTVFMGLAVLLAVVPLVLILYYILLKGLGSIDLNFFTQDPAPPGLSGGGVHNAIIGSLIMVGLGAAIALPFAIGCGLFLAEYGQNRLGTVIRFLVDVMAGIPSITVGLFIYGLIVLPLKTFSAIAGALALSILFLPIVARITEEMALLVPRSLREAAYALGAPRWKTVTRIVLPTALPGIITGVVLALSRIAGDAAPLLFTALGNQFSSTDVFHAMDALPLRIFVYATGPYDTWHAQAWAMSLILVAAILVVSLIARVLFGTRVTVRQ